MHYHLYEEIRNRFYDELANEPAPIREALIFKYTVQNMPIRIKENDVIAGLYGYDEEPVGYSRNPGKFAYDEIFTCQESKTREDLKDNYQIITGFSPGHTCIDYKQIMEHGLVSYVERVENELTHAEENAAKRTMLESMLISLHAVSIYTKRFADLAFSLASNAMEKKDESRLMKIHRALLKVPMQPADDFFEAVQAVWIMHSLIPISDNSWASISLGRLDQYLFPFYKKSMQNGETKDNIKNCLKNLFILLDSYGDGACALNIGGMDMAGNDQMNELSEMLIDVEREMCLRSPIFVARLNPNTPHDMIDQLIDLKLFQIGQPTFYGELPCRKAVQNRGISEMEASCFSVNSCMGLVMAGEEIADMWGCMFNMHLPLELAINNGKPFFGELPVNLMTPPLEKIENISQIRLQYQKYLEELLKIALDHNRKTAINFACNNPNPLLSAITEGCMERGMDRAIGAKYKNVTVEAMGMINTGNAMNVVNTLVFEKQKHTLADIIKVTQNNFEGYDEYVRDIRECEKYGTNNEKADRFCMEIGEIFADACESLSFENTKYLPSLHTLDANVWYGKNLYGTVDGRKKGEPLNKNAGPTNDVRTSEPTSMIMSASKINQQRFSGGQPIDVCFDESSLSTKEGRDKIKHLILTYFELGGLQFQVNCMDGSVLQKAFDNPHEHENLIVRIGGYSARFCDLSRESKLEFIERVKKEEGK